MTNNHKVYIWKLIQVLLLLLIILAFVDVKEAKAQEEEKYELLWKLNVNSTVKCVSISANGEFIAVVSGFQIYLLNKDGELLWSYKFSYYHSITRALISDNGRYVIASGRDSGLFVEAFVFDEKGYVIYKPKDYISSISERGGFVSIITRFPNDVLEYYDSLSSQKPKWKYEIYNGVEALISSNGNYVILLYKTFGGTCWLSLFNKYGEKIWDYKIGVTYNSFSISADGSRIVFATPEEVRMIDRNGNLIMAFKRPIKNPDSISISVSPDGKYIVYTAKNETHYSFLIINDKGEWRWIANSEVSCAAVSLNADYIVAGSGEKVLLFTKASIFAAKALNRAKSAIFDMKSKGFSVKEAEDLLLEAEAKFKAKLFDKAKELADKAYSFALDIDQDGIPNEIDYVFFIFYVPYINNYLIYCGTFFVSIVSLFFLINKKIRKPLPPIQHPSPKLPSPLTFQPPPAPQPPSPIQTVFLQETIQWPSVGEYKMVFQDLSNCILDKEIKNGVVIRKHPKTGIPIPSTGRFACVFKVQCGSKTYAVRCFFNSTITNLQKRYELISRYLSKLSLPFFVKFEFVDKGINIPGKGIYPFIKMEWAEGDLLDIFIEKHLSEKELLEELAERFIKSIIEMEKNKIAHGDLQHGNILVGIKGSSIRIYFVDYDGIFIPEFKGEEAPELGHSNYQHPKRSKKHYNEKIDRFSALVIYLSILAVANDPKLWNKYYNEENLIFTMKDFESPESSEVIQELLNSNSKKVRKLVMFLREALKEDPFFEKTWNEIKKFIFSDKEKNCRNNLKHRDRISFHFILK